MSRQVVGSRVQEGSLAGWYSCADCGGLCPTKTMLERHRCKARER